MKIQQFAKHLLIFSIALGLASCSKDEDDAETVKPTINSVLINGDDHDIEVQVGGNLQITAELADNENLSQFKVDVHDIFDEHSHGKKNVAPWAETATYSISGTSYSLDETMTVATDATAGPYHAIFRLVDAQGNESDFSEIDFIVKNGGEASVNITSPDFSAIQHPAKGSTMSIMGTITDDVDIAEIAIVLAEEGDDHHHGKTSSTIYDADFDLDGSADTSWDFQTDGGVDIMIPADAEDAHYIFTVTVTDNEGNISIFEGEVHIE